MTMPIIRDDVEKLIADIRTYSGRLVKLMATTKEQKPPPELEQEQVRIFSSQQKIVTAISIPPWVQALTCECYRLGESDNPLKRRFQKTLSQSSIQARIQVIHLITGRWASLEIKKWPQVDIMLHGPDCYITYAGKWTMYVIVRDGDG